jgi:hypothetical protein
VGNPIQQNGQASEIQPQPSYEKKRRFRAAWALVRSRGAWLRARWLRITAWAVGSVFVIGVLVVTSHYVADITDPVQFVTGNLLNTLLLVVIIFQARIYHRQADIMERQWQATQDDIRPRLRIADVKAVGLGAGQTAAFVVSLVNEGATEARDVELQMEVRSGLSKVTWPTGQILTVPANGRQEYPFPWNSPLTQQDLNGTALFEPYEVAGYFKHGKGEVQPFCYRYYLWDGPRPEGIPQFLLCNFDPAIVAIAKMADGRTITIPAADIGKKSFSPKIEGDPKTKKNDKAN